MIFVKNKSVEELDLYLRTRDPDEFYSLPQIMYSNACLRELSLCNCNLVPKEGINWPALRVLVIRYAKLNRNIIDAVCSGCPSLESLKFSMCCGVHYFVINSESVKKLVISGYWRQEDEDSDDDDTKLIIYARNVTSLEIIGGFHTKVLVLQNVEALVHAKLDFYRETYDYENDFKTDENMLKDLLGSVRKLRNSLLGHGVCRYVAHQYILIYGSSRNSFSPFMRIGRTDLTRNRVMRPLEGFPIQQCFTRILTMLETRNSSCPRMRCKYLTFNTRLNEREIPGLAILLQSCPQVEFLSISKELPFREYDFGLSSNEFIGENYWISRPCWVLHLKTLRIDGTWIYDSCYSDYIFPFLQAVLKNGMVLEKIILCFLR